MSVIPNRKPLKSVRVDVVAGMAQIVFTPGESTGGGDGTRPGVGFDLLSEVPSREIGDGRWIAGVGVISRRDAKRIADALVEFLAEHPP